MWHRKLFWSVLLSTICLTCLKLWGGLEWSWWAVTSPLWIPAALVMIFANGVILGLVWYSMKAAYTFRKIERSLDNLEKDLEKRKRASMMKMFNEDN